MPGQRYSNKILIPALTFMIIFLLVGALNITIFSHYLVSILMGGIFAIMVRPLYTKMQTRGINSFISALLTTFLISAVLVTPTVLFTFSSAKQAKELATKSKSKTNMSVDDMSEKISQTVVFKSFHISKSVIAKNGPLYIKKASNYISAQIVEILKGIPQALFKIFISLLSCFFFLLDGRKLMNFINTRLPLGSDTRSQLFKSFKDTVGGVTIGSMVAAMAQSFIVLLSFLALDIPNLFLAAFATFIFAWIPLIGCLPVIGAGLIYLFTKDRYIAMGVLAALGLITGLIDNIIRPKFLQGRNELHPLISLIAIFGGIDLFGIVGVFIGPIIAAIFVTLLEIWPKIGENLGYQFETTSYQNESASTTDQKN